MYPLQRCRKRMLRMLVHPGELALFGLLWILIAETPTHCSRIGVWKRALDATELRAVSLIQKTKGTVEAAHGTGAPKEERKTPSSLMTQNSQEKNGFNFASPTGPGKQPVFAQGDDATDNQDKNKNLAALRETEAIATKIGLKSSYVQLASGIAEKGKLLQI
ncbi:hypothetical protein PTTG_27607 [Puccinia triticina 1-1 BBBD Race 1]|uniref:Uncharacterized protein n=3 Tax=Puccinia triticina TaxID=208348 RepID=A0A180GIJ4_PUCT1|nr:uncharacterized protein PtA15_1A479 [Puccinia triticina]OAV92586.1 hypothetical protein PTTG_27607 [Puccinia triticina 1-1 BBBD Race 1]WAQ81140.1 hypothetical protein PtA15_1A479 [Puccinia triticina]